MGDWHKHDMWQGKMHAIFCMENFVKRSHLAGTGISG